MIFTLKQDIRASCSDIRQHVTNIPKEIAHDTTEILSSTTSYGQKLIAKNHEKSLALKGKLPSFTSYKFLCKLMIDKFIL